MTSSVKLVESEMEKVKFMQDTTERIAVELGAIEMQTVTLQSRKKAVLGELEVLNNDRKEFFSYLESKYGSGNLNTQTGEFEIVQQA